MMAASVNTMAPSSIPDPLVVTQTIGKRKRSNDSENPAPAEDLTTDTEITEAKRNRFNALLDDLLEVLQGCDTKPSILNFTIHSTENNTHSAKRTKIDDTHATSTILSRIKSHSYDSIDEVGADIDNVVSAISSSSNDQHLQGSAKFEKVYKEIISREIAQNSDALIRGLSSAHAVKDEDGTKTDSLGSNARSSQVVLTLHGGPGGRQLFSSLRQPPSLDVLDPALSDALPSDLREAALPNGISTTTIVPVHSTSSKDPDVKIQTLGELCPAPSHLTTLDPPKPSTLTSTRGATVGWYKPDTLSLPQKKTDGRATYPNQHLSSGQWLSYNVPPSAKSQSTGDKRKQRDRALSTGETHPERSEEDLERARLQQEAHQQTRDTELYKSVYSSFAPSYDNSASVVPQQLKGQLWWRKVSQNRHRAQPTPEDMAAFEAIPDPPVATEGIDRDTEDRLLQEAADAFDDTPSTLPITEHNQSALGENGRLGTEEKADRDTEEILSEISDLIETLNSYQRVRNMSLATTTQTSAGQNKTLTELSGSPTNPSEAEFNIYTMLRAQLTLMITQLPPYAVAKLNSNQLGELNVSKKIMVESTLHKGLIPDETAKPAQPAINGIATPSMRAPTANTARTAGYQPATTTPHRNSYSAAPPRASNYYPPNRTPAPNTYSSYAQHNTAARTYAQYNQQATPSQTPQYTNSSRALTAQNGYPPSGVSPLARPMHQQQPNRPSVGQYSHQRPPSTPGYAPAGQLAGGRSSSPQNSSHVQGYMGQHHQSSYTTYGQASPQRPLPNVEGMAGTVGQHLHLSAQEQATLIARQKWQMQQAQRAASGTPQAVNGQSPSRPQSNGTPVAPPSASPTPQPVNGV